MTTISPAEALASGYTHCAGEDGDLFTIQQVGGFHAEMSGRENGTERRKSADRYFSSWNLVEPEATIATPPDPLTAAYELLDETSHPEPYDLRNIAPWLAEKLKPILVELNEQLQHFPYYDGVNLWLDHSCIVYEAVEPQEGVCDSEMMSGSSDSDNVARNACEGTKNG